MGTFPIDAAALTDYQCCKRLHMLGNEWRFIKWRPKSLFDTLLRRSILQLGHGESIEDVVIKARIDYRVKAAEPGLDLIGKDPYEVAKGWISLLECVLYGMAKTTIPRLHDPLPAKLNPSTDWRFLSWADDSGQLHRWVTTAEFDREVMFREMHSWRTFGDICMARVPMVLHVLTLGRQQELGRFASAWNRIWQHPGIRGIRVFSKPEEKGWKAFYRTDMPDIEAKDWVETAWREQALQPLMQEFLIEEPLEKVRLDTVRQIEREVEAARVTRHEDWKHLPMSRGECDKWNSPCVFQPACYSAEPYDFENSGLFVRRNVVTVPAK